MVAMATNAVVTSWLIMIGYLISCFNISVRVRRNTAYGPLVLYAKQLFTAQ